MKQITYWLFLVILVFQVINLNAQDNIFQKPDLIKNNHVKSVQAFEYDTLIKKESAVLSFTIDFDKRGNIIKHTSFLNNKSFQTYNYTYDSNSKLSEEQLIDKNNFCQYRKTYKYKIDKTIEEVSFKNGSFEKRIEYTYNNNFEYPIKATYTLSDSSTFNVNYKYDVSPNNKLLAKYTNNQISETYQYDSLDRMIAKNEFDNDSIKNKFAYQYYPNGEFMQVSQYIPSEKTMYRWYYEYNQKGQITKEKEYKSKSLKEYKYDDKGLLIEYIYYDDFKFFSNGCTYKYVYY